MPSHTHNTPALRFPGYIGVWEQKEMQDICHYSKTHSEGNRFIGVEDLHQEFAGVNFDKNRRGNGITYQQGDTLMSNIRPYLKKHGLLIVTVSVARMFLFFRQILLLQIIFIGLFLQNILFHL